MKRIVFRVSVLAIIVALGLLAIAHAQRAGLDAPPDDGSTNPLRNGAAAARGEQWTCRTIGTMQWVRSIRTCRRRESAPPPRRSDGSVRPLVRRRAARPGARPGFGSWPTVSRRAEMPESGQHDARCRESNPNSCRQRPTAMPFPRGRPTRIQCSRSRRSREPPRRTRVSRSLAARGRRTGPRGTRIFPARSARPCRTMRELPALGRRHGPTGQQAA